MNNYNYNYTRPPRKGVIVFVSFVFAAILGIAFFTSYEQRTDLGHSVHLSPSSANYGTVSTARPQGMVVPMQSNAPMLSGGAIRSYAYSGHATMPKASGSGSGFKMYTTSSASVHSLGSGGGGGGGSMSGGSSYGGTSSKGIQYSGGSVSMPSLALATPAYGEESATTTRFGIGRRRVEANGNGSYDGEYYNGQWWNEAADDWVDDPFNGATMMVGGVMCEYKDGEWIPINNQGNPGVPLGDAPWLWMLILAIVYVSAKVVRKRIASLSRITIE